MALGLQLRFKTADVCSLLSTCNSNVCRDDISRSRSFLIRWFSFCKLLNWNQGKKNVKQRNWAKLWTLHHQGLIEQCLWQAFPHYLLIQLLNVVYVQFQPGVKIFYGGYFALDLLILIMSIKHQKHHNICVISITHSLTSPQRKWRGKEKGEHCVTYSWSSKRDRSWFNITCWWDEWFWSACNV